MAKIKVEGDIISLSKCISHNTEETNKIMVSLRSIIAEQIGFTQLNVFIGRDKSGSKFIIIE
jgi:hypothetical protein